MKLSNNFFLSEFTRSIIAKARGISNEIPDEYIENARQLAINVLQPLRDYLNDSIKITSGYRSEMLNAILRGSKTSQHKKAEAVDFRTSRMKDAFFYILENLNFDQLIWEEGTEEVPAWIHVSYKKSGNRKSVLRIKNKQTFVFDLKK